MNPEIIDLPVRQIKPLVSRARAKAPFERMKDSIKEHGIHRPIRVRPLKGDARYKFELIWGEGRLKAQRELRRETIPAIVEKVDSPDAVGMFLLENLSRKKLSWQEKARLIKAQIGDHKIDKHMVNSLAESYFVTPAHVVKLLRILQKAAPKTKETLDKLTVEEAEELTSLPATGQEIVIETLRDEKLRHGAIPELVRKAKAIRQSGSDLSKTALKQSLRRVDEELSRLRGKLKLKRLHWALSVENLKMLLSDKTFRKALDRRGINYAKFEAEIAL